MTELFKQLRDLFTFHSYTACHTHELLGCSCTMIQSSGGPTGLLVGEDEDKFDEEETQISEKKEMGFISASQCKPEALTKMDKAVRTLPSLSLKYVFMKSFYSHWHSMRRKRKLN